MELSRTIETETGEMIVKRVSVPLGLEELMEGLAKEVILKKPKDIYVFASEYFTKLLHLRESGLYRGNVRSAKLAVKQPSKAVVVGHNIFTPSDCRTNTERKPSTPYYLNHSNGSAKQTDEMRRSRIREHLRMKKEENSRNERILSSTKNESSFSSSKNDMKLHKSRPLTRNRRNAGEEKTKLEKKSYERSGSLRGGTKIDSKSRDTSISPDKKNKRDSNLNENNLRNTKRISSRKKSPSVSSIENTKKASHRNADKLKGASLEIDRNIDETLINTESTTKVTTHVDSEHSNNKTGNISSILDDKGHYEVSYNPELLASDRGDKANSAFKKDLRITEDHDTKSNIDNSIKEEKQKSNEEELRDLDTELQLETENNDSEVTERPQSPTVNESSELKAAIVIQSLWRGFQTRKKVNESGKNSLRDFEKVEHEQCVSKPKQKSQMSEDQTINSETKNDNDVSEAGGEKTKDETYNTDSITSDCIEEGKQKEKIQNEVKHCDNRENNDNDEVEKKEEYVNSSTTPSEIDTREEEMMKNSLDVENIHENEPIEEKSEESQHETVCEDQPAEMNKTKDNRDTSEQTTESSNGENDLGNEEIGNHTPESSTRKNSETEILGEAKFEETDNENDSAMDQQPTKDSKRFEGITESPSENEEIQLDQSHQNVSGLNIGLEVNNDSEQYLKVNNESTSTLPNVSQDKISDTDVKNCDIYASSSCDRSKNNENTKMQVNHSSSIEDTEVKIPPKTLQETDHELENANGDNVTSEGSNDEEISDSSVNENKKDVVSNITEDNHSVNEYNNASLEHVENELDVENGNSSTSLNELDSSSETNTEPKVENELSLKLPQDIVSEIRKQSNNNLSSETCSETENEDVSKSSHIETIPSEKRSDNAHNSNNYISNAQGASATDDTSDNTNGLVFEREGDEDNPESNKNLTMKSNQISSNKAVPEDINSSRDNIINDENSPNSKESDVLSTPLLNSFQAKDVNNHHNNNGVDNVEDIKKNINDCISSLSGKNGIVNLDSPIVKKEEENNSDSFISDMVDLTSIDNNISTNMKATDNNRLSTTYKDDMNTSDQLPDNTNVDKNKIDEKIDNFADQENLELTQNLSDQEPEENRLKTTTEVSNEDNSFTENSIQQTISSQNILSNEISRAEEDKKPVDQKFASTESDIGATVNGDSSESNKNEELKPIDPFYVLSTQKENMMEDDSESLKESNGTLKSLKEDDENNESNEKLEESTIHIDTKENDTANSTHESIIEFDEKNKSKSKEKVDINNSQELGEPSGNSCTETQVKSNKETDIHTEVSPKHENEKSQNTLIKKRPNSHRQDTQREKTRSDKSNIRRVKSQGSTIILNQNNERDKSVNPKKTNPHKERKNSVINTGSSMNVTEPLLMQKNIPLNYSGITSASNGKNGFQITPIVSTVSNNEAENSKERNFTTENEKNYAKENSEHSAGEESFDSAIDQDVNAHLDSKIENVNPENRDGFDKEEVASFDKELQKNIHETNDIPPNNIISDKMSMDKSVDLTNDIENKERNDSCLTFNNDDIQHEYKTNESQLSTTPYNGTEIKNEKVAPLINSPNTKGSPVKENSLENFKIIDTVNTEGSDGKSNSSEMENNIQHNIDQNCDDLIDVVSEEEQVVHESTIEESAGKDKTFNTISENNSEQKLSTDKSNNADNIFANGSQSKTEEAETTGNIHPEKISNTPRQTQDDVKRESLASVDKDQHIPTEKNDMPLILTNTEHKIDCTIQQYETSPKEHQTMNSQKSVSISNPTKYVDEQPIKTESEISKALDEQKEHSRQNEDKQELTSADDFVNKENKTGENELQKQNEVPVSSNNNNLPEPKEVNISPDYAMKNLDEINSAIYIQKTWRGFQGRKKIGTVLENKKTQKLLNLQKKIFEMNETDENKNFVSSQDKNLIGTNKPSVNSDSSHDLSPHGNNTKENSIIDNAEEEKITTAALKIQSSFRKFKSRKGKKFQSSPLSHMDSETAKEYINQALKIQSAWRAYKVRKNIREVEEKINEIENHSENQLPKSIHLTDEEILKAVTKIQTNLRGYMARKHFKNLLERNQSLDGIQEETNSETSNAKQNMTTPSDEEILNSLKQLDEISIPNTPPEFISTEREEESDTKSNDDKGSSRNIITSHDESYDNPPELSVESADCSSNNDKFSSSNTLENDSDVTCIGLGDENKTDNKISNDLNSIPTKSPNEYLENDEPNSKISSEDTSDIQKSIPTDNIDPESSDLSDNSNSHHIFSSDTQGSLKKSKATNDLVKLAEEFDDSKDCSNVNRNSFETQKTSEETDSTQVSNSKENFLPDEKLASFEIPDSDIDLEDSSRGSKNHESDTNSVDTYDIENTLTDNKNTNNNNISSKKVPDEVDESVEKRVFPTQNSSTHEVNEFVKTEKTNPLENLPSKTSDLETIESVENDMGTHIQKEQQGNEESKSNEIDHGKKTFDDVETSNINNRKKDLNSRTLNQMETGTTNNVDTIPQETDEVKKNMIHTSKSEESFKVDYTVPLNQSLKSLSLDHEVKQPEVSDFPHENQIEVNKEIQDPSVLIFNDAVLDQQNLTENSRTNSKEELPSDIKSNKLTVFERKQSDESIKKNGTKNEQNNRITLNDFMKKTLNLEPRLTDNKASNNLSQNINSNTTNDLSKEDNPPVILGENALTKIQYDAAVKIQSLYRGYRSRKKTNILEKASTDPYLMTSSCQNEKQKNTNKQQDSEEITSNPEMKPTLEEDTTKTQNSSTITDLPLHENSTRHGTLEKSNSIAVGIQTNAPSRDSNTDEVQENVPGQVFVIIQVISEASV